MHSSPHLNSAVPFLLPFPVKVRVSVIQVEVCLPGPDRAKRENVGSTGASFTGTSQPSGGSSPSCTAVVACVCIWCASSFPTLLRHLPLDLSVPFRASGGLSKEDHGMLVFPKVAVCESIYSWSLRQKGLPCVCLSLSSPHHVQLFFSHLSIPPSSISISPPVFISSFPSELVVVVRH